MFIHFSEREMYIRGGVISKTGRNVCPEFPRNVNGNWGKCMKPKGGGPRLYIFKGVGLSTSLQNFRE